MEISAQFYRHPEKVLTRRPHLPTPTGVFRLSESFFPWRSRSIAPDQSLAALQADLPELTNSASDSGKSRLVFIDGIRALASLYVVLHHCCQIYQDPDATPRYGYYAFIPWLLRGRAVAVFMALSGFVLMLPVAKSSTMAISGGFFSYLKRRARRILPPYYAALALTLLCIAFVPGMNRATGEFWGRALPAFSAGNLVSHLLLMHWVNPAWIYRINPPWWTLGADWALYFIFPTLLLPIWRKWGIGPLLMAGITLGFLPHILLRKTAWHFDWVSPWFIGLFAMGMAGAVLQASPLLSNSATRFKKLLLGPTGMIVLAIGFGTLWKSRVAMDYLFGAMTVWLILYCGQPAGNRAIGRNFLLQLLQSAPLRGIGTFSYSIYLIHGPVLMMLYRLIEPLDLSEGWRAVFMFAAAPSIAVLVAWLFYRTVERPLLPMNHAKKTRRFPKWPCHSVESGEFAPNRR